MAQPSSTYSIQVFAALLLTVAPGLWGWFYGATVDAWPRWFSLISGLALGARITFWRYRREEEAHPPPPSPASSELVSAKSLLWLLGPPCWLMAAALLGNRFLDAGEVSKHTVDLIRYEDRYKGRDVIHVTSWREGHKQEALWREPMSIPGIHRGVAPGTQLVVFTKPGLLGWPWIVTIIPKR